MADTVNLIQTDSQQSKDSSVKWLSMGNYLSAMRNLLMSPIKSELSYRVLQKTALVRDHAPKIIVERIQMF